MIARYWERLLIWVAKRVEEDSAKRYLRESDNYQ